VIILGRFLFVWAIASFFVTLLKIDFSKNDIPVLIGECLGVLAVGVLALWIYMALQVIST